MSRKGEFFMDKLIIGGVEIKNRLFVGSGKYPSNEYQILSICFQIMKKP